MKFEWDEWKASENFKKHGVSFEEASLAFDDPFALNFDDRAHSLIEDRYILIGQSTKGILTVVYTERIGPKLRIISARKANWKERRTYHEQKRKD